MEDISSIYFVSFFYWQTATFLESIQYEKGNCTLKAFGEVILLAVPFRNTFSLGKLDGERIFFCTVLGRLIYVIQQKIYLVFFSENFPLLGIRIMNKLSFFLGVYINMSLCALLFMHTYIQRIQNEGIFAVLNFLACRLKQM